MSGESSEKCQLSDEKKRKRFEKIKNNILDTNYLKNWADAINVILWDIGRLEDLILDAFGHDFIEKIPQQFWELKDELCDLAKKISDKINFHILIINMSSFNSSSRYNPVVDCDIRDSLFSKDKNIIALVDTYKQKSTELVDLAEKKLFNY